MSTTASAQTPQKASPAASPDRHEDELSHRQILTIIAGLMAGMFLAALDQNIVSTAIRTIADDLKGLDEQAWVTTAYLITSTISTPIYGKLSDLYGRKPFFLTAITLFIIGSAACSFANSMYMLAVFRAFQGLGAGGLMSLALAIVGDIVPPRERAKYQGYFLAVFGTSSVLGPVIGGFFADRDTLFSITGWRWVFLINVPIGAIALLMVWFTLHLHHTRRQAKIDWAGAFTLILALVPLLLVAEQGRTWGWDSQKSIICYVVGAVGLISFIAAEHFAQDNALIPLRIFRNRAIAVSLVGGFVVGAGMFGGIMLLPQFYLQIINGSDPTKAGLQMLPMVMGLMIASIVSGQLMTRTGKVRPFPIIGVAVMVVGLVLLSRVTADTDLWKVMIMMFVFGLGLGNTMQPLTLAVQAAVEPKDIGMATSSATFFRQIGGTLGVAIFLSMMFNSVGGHIRDAFTAAAKTESFQAALRDPAVLKDPTNASFIKALTSGDSSALAGVTSDSSIINQLDPRLAHPFKVGFADSMSTIFLVAAIALAVGLLVLFFLPRIELTGHSAAAMQAAARREAEGAGSAGGASSAAGGSGAEASATQSLTATLADESGGPAALSAAGGVPQGDRAGVRDTSTPPLTGAGVFGRVSNGRSGLADAWVTVADHQGHQVGRVRTAADGSFAVPVQSAGSYLLIVAAADVAPNASLVSIVDSPLQRDVTLTGTAWISGRVLQQHLEQEQPNPLADAMVTLTDVQGEVVGTQRSGLDGGYVFEGLTAGQYVLTAQSQSQRPFVRAVDVKGTGATICDLALNDGGRLEGAILAADDRRAVRHAIVTLVGEDGQVAGQLVTGGDGRYRFDDLAEGRYTLTAAGYAPVAREVRVSNGEVSHQSVLLGADGALQYGAGSESAARNGGAPVADGDSPASSADTHPGRS